MLANRYHHILTHWIDRSVLLFYIFILKSCMNDLFLKINAAVHLVHLGLDEGFLSICSNKNTILSSMLKI